MQMKEQETLPQFMCVLLSALFQDFTSRKPLPKALKSLLRSNFYIFERLFSFDTLCYATKSLFSGLFAPIT